LIAIVSLVFSSSTYAASSSSLKDAFDDFKFVMEVEGAALDPDRERETLEILHTRLFLLKNDGITHSEILHTALENVRDVAGALA
jgi:hypothetical protein